ncbi:MAG: DUF4349 domain-containing protein [Clostridiales bacterium]|nr:DUF4349 domain-containing protein [Clostridiales bacterium]
MTVNDEILEICLKTLPDVDIPKDLHNNIMKYVRAETKSEQKRFVIPQFNFKLLTRCAAGVVVTLIALTATFGGINSTLKAVPSKTKAVTNSVTAIAEINSSENTISKSVGIENFEATLDIGGINKESDIPVTTNNMVAEDLGELFQKSYNLVIHTPNYENVVEYVKELPATTLRESSWDKSENSGTIRTNLTLLADENNYRFLVNTLSQIEGVKSVEETNIKISSLENVENLNSNKISYLKYYESLLNLMPKASTVKDMITIDNSLSSTLSKLDYFNGRISYYNKISQSPQLNITVIKSQDSSLIETKSFADKMQTAFKGSISNIYLFLSNTIVFIVSVIIPVGILITLFLIIFIAVKNSKRRRLRNEG